MGTTNPKSEPSQKLRLSGTKLWCFRCLAVVGGLLVVVLLEVVLQFATPDVIADDDWLKFDTVRPLFVLNSTADRYEIPKSRRTYFVKDSFPVVKSPNTFRIFCLGGSTVQGRPFSTKTAFSTFLRIGLETIDRETNWEVINCGGVSYASYRLRPILDECLQHEPDLIVLCTGHNEFLEDRSYAAIEELSAQTTQNLGWLSRSKLFRLINQQFATSKDSAALQYSRDILPEEVDALLDHQNGLELYERNDRWKQSVQLHFQRNVGQMIDACQTADVPVVLMSPAANLADCPPFKSVHADGLTATQKSQWTRHIERARSLFRTNSAKATVELQAALNIDDQHASTWYELGHCHLALHHTERAIQAFERARDEDVCPLRIRSEQRAMLAQIATERNVPHVDLQHVLMQAAQTEILGDSFMVDHVHPSIEGHQIIARALLHQMASLKFITPSNGWKDEVNRTFREHFQELANRYFAKGRQRLKNLQAWAAGRADGPIAHRKSEPEGDSRGEPGKKTLGEAKAE